MHPRKTFAPLAVVAVAVIAIDQLAKLVAMHNPGVAIVPVTNADYSLGLASGPPTRLVLVSVLGIVAFGGAALRMTMRGVLPPWVVGLLVGGSISNVGDRIVLGSVRDFLVTPFAIVNFADLAVVVGVVAWSAAILIRRPNVDSAASGP